jgi:hypothetical protein
MAAATDGSGLWLVTATGTVEALGGVTRSDDAVVDQAVTAIVAHSADGYWVATSGAGPGAITGRVVDDAGQPVAGLCVSIDAFMPGTTTTAPDGTFRIAIGQGTYRVRFGGCPGDDRYLPEYWKDATAYYTAQTVTVTGGHDTALGDAVVARAAVIEGVVTRPDGAPLTTACTTAFSTDNGSFGGQARTSVTGYYRLGGLRGTSYQVQFNDCVADEYLGEFYDDAASSDLATPVAVAPGQTRSGIDAQLAKAGAITGTVATTDGGNLGPACVTATSAEGGFKQVNIVSGAYRLTGLGTSTYKVHFNDCAFGSNSFAPRNDYVDEWWESQASEATATPVAVTAGQDTTGISTVLGRAATISGTVTLNGNGAGFMCVDAVQGTTAVRRTSTALSGTYQLRGLRPGSYAVRFTGCTSAGPTATEWWPNQPSLASATPVAVAAGEGRTGIDAALDPGGYVQGQVTDRAGNPVVACVDTYDEVGMMSRDFSRYGGVTGAYRIGGLNDNSYRLRFTDCSGNPNGKASEWYDDAVTKTAATPVTGVRTQTTTLAPIVLDDESVISGTVTSPTGAPVSGVCVRTFGPDGSDMNDGFSTVFTTVTGFYRVTRLPASSYKVQFDTRCGGSSYGTEWWNDQPTQADATPVVTSVGATTSGIDAVLSVRTGSQAGVPAAPGNVNAVAGTQAATVTWTAAAGTHGAITGYRITASPGGATQVVGADARSAQFDGLQAGQGYTFSVQASTAFGYGTGATSNQVTPNGPPAAPAKPTATAGHGEVTVGWTAPAANGSAITAYVVRASDGVETLVGGGSTSVTVTRPNGVAVSFTVVARNTYGDSGPSPASDTVTPTAPAPDPSPSQDPPAPEPSPSQDPPAADVPVVQAGDAQPEPVPSGTPVLFTGSGFLPFATGDVIINSTPRKLGSFVADAGGNFQVLVTVPADLELGNHTLVAVGKAPDGSVRTLSTPLVVVSAAAARGYRLLAADGGLFTFGESGFFGSAGGTPQPKPIVGGATTPSGNGYWLVSSDGALITFGDANYFGSLAGKPLNQPIVGMAATPTGKGYWLVATDGGMFAFGDAAFLGSTGAIKLNKPIVGMTSTPSGKGYWLVASDGGIFSFGDASFAGSTGAIALNKPIVGMSSTPTGNGYWLVASDGGIFAFGDAAFLGSAGAMTLNQPIVGMSASPTGDGYRLVAADGGISTFGRASYLGSTGDLRLARPIIAIL